ncbi:hypothetical protein ACIO6T_21890 [Streptomyces sp. NPDC087532]|uniref:hypothetical protein n=1 Tax=Streptomyces sp. NPDC087532 TaxID=3365795 RepID=UPI0038177EF6
MTGSSHAHGSGDTKARHPVQETLAHPMQMATTAVERVPGADRAKEFVDGVLDSVGIVSPHARRVAAYAGAGLLGVVGVVEWPVAAAGAAAVWLTQQRPKDAAAVRTAGESRAEGASTKRTAKAAKASTATRKAKAPAGKAKSRPGKAKSRPGKAGSVTAKTRAPKSASTTSTAKARSSGRTAKSAAAGTSRTGAGARKKT